MDLCIFELISRIEACHKNGKNIFFAKSSKRYVEKTSNFDQCSFVIYKKINNTYEIHNRHDK